MQFYEEDKFVLKVDGEEKTFYTLLTFTSTKTNKDYIIYTDKTMDGDKLNIFSGIVTKGENGTMKIDKVTSDIDKEEVAKALIKNGF